MSVAIVTGSAGLVGSSSCEHFAGLGYDIVGIDNDMRAYFFGKNASTALRQGYLKTSLSHFQSSSLDIRDADGIMKLFKKYGSAIRLVVHTAGQPSHDWAAREPITDFSINAVGTMNLLEATRIHCPQASFVFTSSNKVYGDQPNRLPLTEGKLRWEIAKGHEYFSGIDESMSIDQCLHSLMGASKVAADIFVQEYGRYFSLNTAVFRAGCITGPAHAGDELHGFLAYLMKCATTGKTYRITGHKGKQVRDNIHSKDLVTCFQKYSEAPKPGEVFNIGGGRENSCSVLEAIGMCQQITGRELKTEVLDKSRKGDHIWYISDLSKFKSHYKDWSISMNLPQIFQELYDANSETWKSQAVGS